jgi:hypothetical protein
MIITKVMTSIVIDSTAIRPPIVALTQIEHGDGDGFGARGKQQNGRRKLSDRADEDEDPGRDDAIADQGAVMSTSVRSRVAPKMRLASPARDAPLSTQRRFADSRREALS